MSDLELLSRFAGVEPSIPALDADGRPIAGKGIPAWVNSGTYLPVRIGLGMIGGPDPKSGSLWTEDFT